MDDDSYPLEGVSIHYDDQYFLTDSLGQYQIEIPQKNQVHLTFHHLSYKDTSILLTGDQLDWAKIALSASTSQIDIITIESNQVNFESAHIADKIGTEYHIDPNHYFSLNGASHLTDMLKNISGLQEQVGCGICFTNSIRINGLAGEQTALMIDNIPIYGSLSSIYGLNSIPTIMIERIELAKGSNTSEFAADGIAGTLNIVTKKHTSSTPISFHSRINTHLQQDYSLSASYSLGKIQALSGINYSRSNTFFDDNNDLFSDEALFDRLSLFTKFRTSFNELDQTLFLKYYYEDRRNGLNEFLQNERYRFLRGSDEIYGESIYTHRIELIGQSQLSSKTPLSLFYNGSIHWQNSFYGNVFFKAKQYTASLHLSWKKLFTKHSLHGVLSYRFQYNDQEVANISDINGLLSGALHIPGLYVRHLWLISPQINLSSGFRLDYYNEHGIIPTPRLHLKYSPNLYTNLRLNIGTGFRIPNLLNEEHAFLSSNRTLIIDDQIQPERSFNTSLQLDHTTKIGKQNIHFNIESFYTFFTQPIYPDFSVQDAIVYKNENARSHHIGFQLQYAHSFHFPLQIELNYQFLYARIHQEINNDIKIKEIEFVPAHVANIIARYDIKKWDMDISYRMNLTGPMRLPSVYDFDGSESNTPIYRPNESPLFTIHSFQVNKHLHKYGIELYIGIENLFDYRQPFSPISGVQTKGRIGFGDSFDTSYSFSSVNGIYGYMGIRWTMHR